jgi:hypothetical protein
MPLPLKDLVKLNQIIGRIQSGHFDANDADSLLMKLRPYAGKDTVFFELANFVAHSDARDRGLAQRSITGFVDSIQYIQEYVSEKRPLDLGEPLPAYIYRLFLSQAHLSDERRLKAEHRMSRATLIKKIEANFSMDKKSGTCGLRKNKIGAELIAALQYITGFIYSRPAFHIRDFHRELKDVMRAQKVDFDEVAWSAQTDRISLAILCLVSNTEFVLTSGSRATCKLGTENDFRILHGQRRLPTGAMSSEPTSFGKLIICGEATVNSANKAPLKVSFPLIDTDLDPHEHCDPKLFLRDKSADDFGGCTVEIINFAQDMSLTAAYRLVRTESLVQ